MRVTNLVAHHFAGTVCAGATWDEILSKLEGHDPVEVFGECVKGIQLLLIRLYLNQPESLRRETSPERVRIDQWCRDNCWQLRVSPPPTAP